MKPRLLLALAAALSLAAPSTFAASGALKDKAVALVKSNKDSVLYIEALVSLEITVASNPPQKEEKKTELIGTVLDQDGLIVASLSSLDTSSALDGRTVNTQKGPMKLSVKGEIKEVKIIMPDGSEVPAKVVLKDADLDLAFLKPEKPGTKFTPINTKDQAPLGLLDDVIVLGRLGKDLNREPYASTNEIIAIVNKPRTFGKCGAQAIGLPIFNAEGKFIGFGVNRCLNQGATSRDTRHDVANGIHPFDLQAVGSVIFEPHGLQQIVASAQ